MRKVSHVALESKQKNNQQINLIFIFITKTYLYSFDPFKPHFYIVKLWFTGVYIIFLISAQKHRLCFYAQQSMFWADI